MTTTVRKFAVGVATAALVAGVAAPAMAADYTANRLAGDTRYDTAIEVANHAFPAGSSIVYIARGDNLVDAIAAGALDKGPLLLVNGDAAVQTKVKTELVKLGAAKVVIVGGKDAVSEETVKAILPSGAVSTRIEGETRYETAAKIAEMAAGLSSTKTVADSIVKVYLANGQTMIDALTGGQLPNGVILLTDGTDKLPKATADALNKHFYNSTVTALGGVNAVSDAALTEANVAKVILTDTFIQDFQAEIKAAADADLKAKGYYTVSSKANKDDVLDLIGDGSGFKAEVNRAKAEATWPKIASDIAPAGAFYVQTDADGNVIEAKIAVPGTKAQALQYKSTTAKDGTTAVNYLGTTAAKTLAGQDLATKQAVATALVSSLDSNPASGNDASTTAHSSVYGATNTFKQLGVTVKDAAGDEVASPTYGQLASTLSITLPTDAWTGATLTTVQNAFKGAVQTKLAALQVALNTATSDDKTAVDAAKTANDTLSDRLEKRIPASTLNRIAGADRYATAVEIAKKVYGETGANPTAYLYFANGERFADAAVAGLIDNSQPSVTGPILLVKKDSIPSVTAAYAKALDAVADYQRKNIYAIGGPAVISDDNFGAELDALAPANQASGTISFGTWDTTGANNIVVTTKDMPNGSTLKLVWEYRDDNHTTWKSFADAAAYAIGYTGDDSLNSTDNHAGFQHSGATAAGAEVRLTVKALAKNGEEITSATSTAKTVGLNANAFSAVDVSSVTISAASGVTAGTVNLTGWATGMSVKSIVVEKQASGTGPWSASTDLDVNDNDNGTLTLALHSGASLTQNDNYRVTVVVEQPGFADVSKTSNAVTVAS